MKNIVISIIVVLSIIAGLAYAANRGQDDTSSEESTSSSKTLLTGTVVYDVRTPAEFAESHADGATLLPLSDIQQGIYPSTAKDEPIAVYCRSGNRSAQATQILQRAGFSNITDMGGLANIEAYGLRLTTS